MTNQCRNPKHQNPSTRAWHRRRRVRRPWRNLHGPARIWRERYGRRAAPTV